MIAQVGQSGSKNSYELISLCYQGSPPLAVGYSDTLLEMEALCECKVAHNVAAAVFEPKNSKTKF